MINTIENLLEKTFTNIKPYYIGVFVKGKAVASHYVKKSEKLEESFSRMVEYSIKIDDAIKNFKPEFLFSDGKDFSIMVYYITNDIAIGIINLGKSNFSLLKITAQDLAKELEKYEKDLLLYHEEHLKIAEEQDIKQHDALDELEKVLTSQPDSVAKETLTESTTKESNIPEKSENEVDIITPSLEDILSTETQDISTPVNTPKPSESNSPEINKILSEIEEEFIKIAGPFGRYVFKNRKNKLLQKSNIAKSDVLEFIQSLAEDMPEIEKRDLFLKNTKGLLIYVL